MYYLLLGGWLALTTAVPAWCDEPSGTGKTAEVDHAVDLDRLERKIQREPAYRSGRPLYAMLAFGQHAQTRLWLVQDGEDLYVDLDADGDLTDPGEHLQPLPEHRARYVPIARETWFWGLAGLLAEGGRPRHTDFEVIGNDAGWQHVSLKVRHPAFAEPLKVTVGWYPTRAPQSAPVLWCDGPLRLVAVLEPEAERRTSFSLEVRAELPSRGFDPERTYATPPGVTSQVYALTPADLELQIKYPMREGGERVIRAKAPCIGGQFTDYGYDFWRKRSPEVPKGVDPRGEVSFQLSVPPALKPLISAPLEFRVPASTVLKYSQGGPPPVPPDLHFGRN